MDRMDEIVRYQLRKPAATAVDKLPLAPVPVEKEVARLIDGLRKVYRDKNPEFEVVIEKGMRFAIREGGRTIGAGVVSKIVE